MMGVFTAIAAGCSAILKPSELTPLTGQLVVDLAREAGLPPDLVQVVHGDGSVGATLVASGVDFISFTGSPSTGRKVALEAARTFTPVVLELGGKDAMVVLEDADAMEAARCAVWGSTLNAGQICISVERVYVPTVLYGSFIQAAEHAMDQLSVGTGDTTDIGPITDLRQLDIIEQQVSDAVAKGATVRRGGEQVTIAGGVYYQPTLITDVDHSMEIMQAETFGPVLAVMEVPNEAMALKLANESSYGLHGSVWSRNKRRAASVASRLDTGAVAVNDHLINVFTPGIPFGGVKDSGIGSELGPEGIRAFCHPKGITSPRLISTSRILVGWQWMPRRVGPAYWKMLARTLYRW